jgi:hypothetical protein
MLAGQFNPQEEDELNLELELLMNPDPSDSIKSENEEIIPEMPNVPSHSINITDPVAASNSPHTVKKIKKIAILS